MKPLYDLTNIDLQKHPIWMIEGGPDEQAIIKPAENFDCANERAYIARTKFKLADGTEMFGYCSPTDDSGLDYIQPVIITANGHARFWYDNPPNHPEPDYLCSLLGRNVDRIFPVKYECEIPFEGHHVSGILNQVNVPSTATQSGSRGFLTPSPHTTLHAGPHRAVHDDGAHKELKNSHEL